MVQQWASVTHAHAFSSIDDTLRAGAGETQELANMELAGPKNKPIRFGRP